MAVLRREFLVGEGLDKAAADHYLVVDKVWPVKPTVKRPHVPEGLWVVELRGRRTDIKSFIESGYVMYNPATEDDIEEETSSSD